MAKFQIYLGNDNQYHWRLKSINGEIVCWSEAYKQKQSATDSINWVKKYAAGADIEEL
ncbi:MAG: DUF1508 domain-containing protein [Candidatus Parcubacteria bacterium]|nr:DUF1508 domain-containing protein [Candidatus Parcubacteria bacterium]